MKRLFAAFIFTLFVAAMDGAAFAETKSSGWIDYQRANPVSE